jgi:hypothetical protein
VGGLFLRLLIVNADFGVIFNMLTPLWILINFSASSSVFMTENKHQHTPDAKNRSKSTEETALENHPKIGVYYEPSQKYPAIFGSHSFTFLKLNFDQLFSKLIRFHD